MTADDSIMFAMSNETVESDHIVAMYDANVGTDTEVCLWYISCR